LDNLGVFQFGEESKTVSDMKALLHERTEDTTTRFPHQRDST